MKYGYTEIRRITAQALRKLCAENEWYTCGDPDEYEHLLFDLAQHKANVTTDDIIEIASDIIEHSELVSDIEYVAFKVANIARVYIVEKM